MIDNIRHFASHENCCPTVPHWLCPWAPRCGLFCPVVGLLENVLLTRCIQCASAPTTACSSSGGRCNNSVTLPWYLHAPSAATNLSAYCFPVFHYYYYYYYHQHHHNQPPPPPGNVRGLPNLRGSESVCVYGPVFSWENKSQDPFRIHHTILSFVKSKLTEFEWCWSFLGLWFIIFKCNNFCKTKYIMIFIYLLNEYK
jgi:hypothetical protein